MILSEILEQNTSLFSENTVVGLFRIAASWYPDKTAVSDSHSSLTYRELDAASDRLAAYLLCHEKLAYACRKGSDDAPSSEEIIAVSIDRSPEAVIAVLGIWKAGAGCMALDAQCPKVLTQRRLALAHTHVIIDSAYLARALREQPGCPSGVDLSTPDRTAMIIFTSGSTGEPKGVRLLHANIAASIRSFRVLPLYSTDIYASFASLVFVAALYDIAVCLTLGCTLVFVPDDIRRDIRRIAQFYIKEQISVSFLPPHMACKYMDVDAGSPLRLLLVGSETVRNLRKRPYEIVNVYASSEACAIISTYKVREAADTYPIGTPVPGLHAFLLSEDGLPAAEGETGELWISGPQVFHGYLNLPALNRERFRPNPFDKGTAGFEKMFRTGDLARRENGQLIFAGRKDSMYKIRGFRVEGEAVERAILSCPEIKEAAAVCHTDNRGARILFAYFSADHIVDHRNLRDFLAARIPYYEIPTGLIQLPALPRTLSGKIDRHAFQPPAEIDDYKLVKKLYY